MGAVSPSDDSLVARGRAIFESLRQPGAEPDEPAGDESGEAVEAEQPVTASPQAPAPLVDGTLPNHVTDPPPPPVRPTEVSPPVEDEAQAPAVPADPSEVAPLAVDEEASLPTASALVVEEELAPLAVPVVTPGPNAFARPMPRVMAVANQKGGVGKTTTAVNLGAALAELGYRVLVVDLDPQGNATTGLGVNPRNLEHSVYDVIMHDTPIEDCIEPTSLRNLFVVPSTIDLAGAEIELVPTFNREQKLRKALDRLEGEFEFTLIDCPPSLGLITINGLAAASEVIVPIQCEYYALEGLGQLLRNVNLVQGNLNPRLEVSAIVLTMYDARTKLSDQVANEVRKHFGDRVCRSIVPRTVRLSEAPSFGQPIIVFDPSSRGALAYRELAKEVSGGAPQRVG
jgi:chromosome partitioning protein